MPHATWPTGIESRPLVIGIAGGSGSGKTTIADSVVSVVGEETAVLVQHDAYYRHTPHLSFAERSAVNYDHPDSLETELLVKHLETLREGRSVERPAYDFSEHLRRADTVTVHPRRVVLVEGILVLAEPDLRGLMDMKIYIDTDGDLRLARRLQRDVAERGRSVESVINQYMETVRPMHLQFVEPSKRYADVIIPEGYNTSAVGMVIRMIRDITARARS